MKKRKLKKLAKLISNQQQTDNLYSKKTNSIVMEKKEEMQRCSFDKEVSDRFFNFIYNIIKLKSYIDINIFDSCISISGDLSQSTSNKNQDFYINIMIDKEGFRLNRISYCDDTLFDRIRPAMIEKDKIVSKEIINDIMDDIMVKTNLSRENNLDELLK